MAQMKTVTINGVTYKIEDPDALSGTDTTLSEANKAADAAAVGAALAGKAPVITASGQFINTVGWHRIGKISKYMGYRVALASVYETTGDFAAVIDVAATYSSPVLNKTALAFTTENKVVTQVRLVNLADNAHYYVDFYYAYPYGGNTVYAHIDGPDGWLEQYKAWEVITDANLDGTVYAALAL